MGFRIPHPSYVPKSQRYGPGRPPSWQDLDPCFEVPHCLLTDFFNLLIPCASLLVTTVLSRDCENDVADGVIPHGHRMVHLTLLKSIYIQSKLRKLINQALGDYQSEKVSFSMCIFCVPL